jgi:class 3 adenylate cyclase
MGCGECDRERLKGHRFCSNCGNKLASAAPASAAAPETERRQITVLFYDLVGSTELSNAVEPEDFREAISNFHSIASAAVQPFDAFIGAHVGDGGIVYFGYPVAREDAAECAVLSGLALIEAVSKITLPNGKRARARVGIATGTSIVGRIEVGDTGNSAVGQVTSLAARLQSCAKPDQCVISNRTRRLVGELFELEDLGVIEAKGFTDNVHAFGVIARSEKDRFRALRSEGPAMVGREEQTRRVLQKWARTLEGEGQMCMVVGEPGVGKSRFAAEFVASLDRSSSLCIKCFCTPHSRQAALRPFIAHFRKLAGARDQQAVPSLPVFLEKLAPGTTDLDRFLLARMIDLDHPEPPEAAGMTSNQLREATILALIHQLRLLSLHRPVALMIEDLHWADPSSRDLLDKVLNGADIGRALVLITARPEVFDTWHTREAIDTVELPPLSEAESRDLVNQVLGGNGSEKMVRAITERAGGIALFIEELSKAILDADVHRRGGGTNGLEIQSGFALPETLQDSLLARLDQLGEAKRVAQIASVIGREFNAAEVVRIAPEVGDLVESGCEKLRAAGLVVPLPGDGEDFQFRHVLIQEIAYSTLVRGERREYNARLLDALEADAGPGHTIDAERWAQYAWEAGRAARSIHYWLQAGREAMRSFAMKEAEARLRRGLELIDKVDSPRERAALELDLLLALGKVLLSQVGHANPETGEIFARAKVLAEAAGERGKLLASMHGQQAYDLQLSRIQAARERGDEMLALAARFNDDAWRLIGYRSRGIANFPLGDYRQCADDLQTGIALLRKTGPAFARDLVADDLLAAMQIYASWSLIYIGETEKGRALCRAACERAELIRQPYTRAFAYVGRNYCQLLLHDFDGLEEGLKECISLCEENEIFYFLLTERVHLAHYYALRGDGDAAEKISEAIDGYRQTGSILYQPTYKHWEGMAWLAQGNLERAREANEWAIETARTYGMHHMMGEYYALKSVLDDREGREKDALDAATAAQDWVRDQGAVLSGDLNRSLWERFGISITSPA